MYKSENCEIIRKNGKAYVFTKDSMELFEVSDNFSDEEIWEIFPVVVNAYCRGLKMGKLIQTSHFHFAYNSILK